MSKIIDFSKPVKDTIKEYPEAQQILKNLGFNMLDNPTALATLGRFTSINKGARIKNIPIKAMPTVNNANRGFAPCF